MAEDIRKSGVVQISTNYEVRRKAPFDARMICPSKAALINQDSWAYTSTYVGMLVVVTSDPDADNNGLYVLTVDTPTVESAWKKFAGVEDFADFQAEIEADLTNYVSKEEAAEFVKMVIVEEGVDITTAVPQPEEKTLYFQKQDGNLYEYISYNGALTQIGSNSGGSVIDAYTKAEADARFALKTDLQGFITNTVDDLVNYYTKSETYNREEITNLIGQISSISFEVVDQLPASGESNKIYLVPKTSGGVTQDGYNEYVWFNSGWERIGSTDIDLSRYATIDQMTSAISTAVAGLASEEFVTGSISTATADMATNASVAAKLAGYVTNESLTTTLNGYALSSAIPTSLSQLTNDAGFATLTEVSSLLADYVKSNDLTSLLAGKQDTLVSGTNIKTINGQSILGEGNIEIQGGSGGPISPATEDTLGGILATDSGTSQDVSAYVDVEADGKAFVKIPSVDETSTQEDVVNLLNTDTLVLNGNGQ